MSKKRPDNPVLFEETAGTEPYLEDDSSNSDFAQEVPESGGFPWGSPAEGENEPQTAGEAIENPDTQSANESMEDFSGETAPEETVETESEKTTDMEDPTPPGKTLESGTEDMAAPRRTRRRRGAIADILTVEGELTRTGSAEVDDKETEIYASRASRKPIEVNISSVENNSGSEMPVAACMYGAYKILVPFNEMNIALSASRDAETEMIRARKVLLSMVGASIDIIIRGIDFENHIAAGSRRQAMYHKQRTILNATDQRGNFRVYEGLNCEARVVAVVPQMARLELFGIEVRLPATEYKWEYVPDLSTELFPGDRIVVRITRMDRDEQGQITAVRVSHRATIANVQCENAKRIKANSRCGGVIENFAKGVYFVKLHDIDVVVGCVVSQNYTFTSPRRGDTVMVLIRDVDEETGRINGSITRIIKSKHKR